MRDFHLRFCVSESGQGWYTDLFDLLHKKEPSPIEAVPSTGGAYVLGTSDGTMLTYPWGTSPIFYIGKATNLRRRLETHKKHIRSAEDDHEETYYWQRYQYGAAFGADCAYYSRIGPQNVQNIEARLIERFYRVFGAIPAANSSWPREIRPKQSE